MMLASVRRAVVGSALVYLALLASGCENVVYIPTKVDDPVPIYLAEYNIHSTILMPTNGKYVDYSFGDWNYAALRHKFINDALFALFASGESTLERRYVYKDPHTGEPIMKERVKPDMVLRLYADKNLVKQRISELEARFEHDLQAHGPHDSVFDDMDNALFAKDSEHYGITNNCNLMTAETFRALGFRVDGNGLTNIFHIRQGNPPPAQD